MTIQKDYIEDLTNFSGSLNELKQIVDHLYDRYGWHSNISVESTADDCVSFLVTQDTRH